MRISLILLYLTFISVFSWSENLNEELLKTNDSKRVLELIRLGADVNYNNNLTPLIYACLYGNLDKVRILLENSAKPNLRTNDEFKKTAIMYSVWFGPNNGVGKHPNLIPITKLLIQYGADVNVREKEKTTALNYAIEANGFTDNDKSIIDETLKVMKILLDAGADKDSIKEALKSVNNQLKISEQLGKPYPEFQKEIKLLQTYLNFNPKYKTKVNLRLREESRTNSKIIVILDKGTRIVQIEKGNEETIDGIKGKWVKIKTVEGTSGWCFDGYLEELK